MRAAHVDEAPPRRGHRQADRGMSVDHFEQEDRNAYAAFAPEWAKRFYGAVDWTSRRVLGVKVDGIEQIPAGRALLVANHAFGFDVGLAIAAISRTTGRRVWVLGEHAWWSVPFIRKVAAAVGVVDGTPRNADSLLSRDELVVVLPGGLREAVKPHLLRYRLLWGHRYGFIRAAIRNGAPVLPLASLGPDDFFDLVGNAFQRGKRWLGRANLPIPLPSRILPIPHWSRIRYVIGEPIDPPAPSFADDAHALRRMRREVEGALHEIIEVELARRAGIELDFAATKR
jgi:1-acyl-sn-glycerol-3-phosphate acyltransferase